MIRRKVMTLEFWFEVTCEAPGIQAAHIRLGARLLAASLPDISSHTQLKKFFAYSEQMRDTALAAKAASRSFNWNRKTETRAFSVARRLLIFLGAPVAYTKRTLATPHLQQRNASILMAIPLKYRRGETGNTLKRWSFAIRGGTRVKSSSTLRTMISFYIYSLLPILGCALDIELPEPQVLLKRLFGVGVIDKVCGSGRTQARRWRWVCDFFEHILEVDRPELGRHVMGRIQSESYTARGDNSLNSHDHHRISNVDLEVMERAFSDNTLDHLIFHLLLTTGLRIGGAARIKLCDVMDSQGKAKHDGQTIEKGGHIVSFRMRRKVRDLLEEYIKDGRNDIGSDYLFPGRVTGWVSTDTLRKRFRQRCNSSRLAGTEFHPHALRHTFAHLLLESGTDLQDISRLLNHSNVQTTQKFYLSESLDEFLDRANIPMYKEDAEITVKKKHEMPSFLLEDKFKQKKRDSRQKKLDMFNDTLSRLKKIKIRSALK
jgi:site-specific recombinase XerD